MGRIRIDYGELERAVAQTDSILSTEIADMERELRSVTREMSNVTLANVSTSQAELAIRTCRDELEGLRARLNALIEATRQWDYESASRLNGLLKGLSAGRDADGNVMPYNFDSLMAFFREKEMIEWEALLGEISSLLEELLLELNQERRSRLIAQIVDVLMTNMGFRLNSFPIELAPLLINHPSGIIKITPSFRVTFGDNSPETRLQLMAMFEKGTKNIQQITSVAFPLSGNLTGVSAVAGLSRMGFSVHGTSVTTNPLNIFPNVTVASTTTAGRAGLFSSLKIELIPNPRPNPVPETVPQATPHPVPQVSRPIPPRDSLDLDPVEIPPVIIGLGVVAVGALVILSLPVSGPILKKTAVATAAGLIIAPTVDTSNKYGESESEEIEG